MRRRLLAVLALLLPVVAQADLAQEWRTADEAAARIPAGEQVWLNAGTDRFWAIYGQPARKEPRGAAIVLPNPDQRPVAAQGAQPLAANLRSAGWQVLVLQPPVLDGALFRAAAMARLEAAVAWLAEKKQLHMALVGLGDSAAAALDYAVKYNPKPAPTPAELEELRQRGQQPPPIKPEVRVLALVDLPWREGEAALAVERQLAEVRMPVADYYWVRAGAQMDAWAKQRRVAARANDAYRQLRFSQPDSTTEEAEPMLVRRLAGWLGNALRDEIEKLPKPQPKAPANPAPAAPAAVTPPSAPP